MNRKLAVNHLAPSFWHDFANWFVPLALMAGVLAGIVFMRDCETLPVPVSQGVMR